MIKRIEFSLNLDDPQEAKIYRALRPSLHYRRGGAVIRQALRAFLTPHDQPLAQEHNETGISVQEIVDEQA